MIALRIEAIRLHNFAAAGTEFSGWSVFCEAESVRLVSTETVSDINISASELVIKLTNEGPEVTHYTRSIVDGLIEEKTDYRLTSAAPDTSVRKGGCRTRLAFLDRNGYVVALPLSVQALPESEELLTPFHAQILHTIPGTILNSRQQECQQATANAITPYP